MSKRLKAGDGKNAVGIAFDIDGVFKYGREWSPDGLGALQRVAAANVPFVFVTNGGGGLTEERYAAGFANKVSGAGTDEAKSGPNCADMGVNQEAMILSYSPWQTQLAPDLKNERVLLVGDPVEQVMSVAQQYGLTKAVHYAAYATTHPTLNPFRQAQQSGTSHTAVANTATPSTKTATTTDTDDGMPFRAILVMCDPWNWFEALQCCVDVLCSPVPSKLEYDPAALPVPVHFSNPDILWKAQHPFPRFGQGAFKIALKALYKTRLHSLRIPEETHDERVANSFRQWGKPTDATFRFLEERLKGLADAAETHYYMVGDNPASDMEGVRRANIFHRAGGDDGIKWAGVLVRTGVFKDGDETNGAATVADGVKEAVEWILQEEGLE